MPSKGIKPTPEALQVLVDAVVRSHQGLGREKSIKSDLTFYYKGSHVTEEELDLAISNAMKKSP